MRKNVLISVACGGIACALSCGCSETPAPPEAAATIAVPQDVLGPRPDAPSQPTEADPTEKEPVVKPVEDESVAFNPPYGERVELFLPPSRKHVAGNAKASSNSEVLLRGFVNVDEPRALLVLDGQLKSLAAGERLGDVEVIQIECPAVTLQRGRVRWTETLYPEI